MQGAGGAFVDDDRGQREQRDRTAAGDGVELLDRQGVAVAGGSRPPDRDALALSRAVANDRAPRLRLALALVEC